MFQQKFAAGRDRVIVFRVVTRITVKYSWVDQVEQLPELKKPPDEKLPVPIALDSTLFGQPLYLKIATDISVRDYV